MRYRWRRLAAALVAVGVTTGAVVAVVVRTGAGGDDPMSQAIAAGREFLDDYVDADGRVVRHDEGGDTVSEGQAYALLVAAGLQDEERFRAIWTWTDEHLQRDDGLLAWRWADGAIADPSPASDADVIAAGALVLAGQRFDDPRLLAEGRAISAAVLRLEAVTLGSAAVLLAGPWAAQERIVNPSYLAVGVMSRLYEAGEWAWRDVAATSRRLIADLTADSPNLVPDWATASPDGTSVSPRAAPGGTEAHSGYEAGRAYVQLAVDCNSVGQNIAARAWPFLADEASDGGTINAAYRLDGTPVDTSTHPLALVAAASSAAAADDNEAAAELLEQADEHDEQHPTYFGAAWIALARLWLDTNLLGGCRPGEPTS